MPSIYQLDAQSLFEHTSWMRGLAQRLVSGPQADDLVQEAWAVAMDRPPADDVPLKAWLSGIMRRAALNTRRSDRHRTDRESSASKEPSQGTSDAAPVDELVALADEKQFLINAVLQLPEAQRQVILLRYYEGLAPREIAAQLSLPVNTVQTHRERGLAGLRESLDRRHDGDRRAWGLALLPLAREATVAQKALLVGGGAAATTAAHGLSLATMKALAVLAAIVAVLVGARLLTSSSDQLDAAAPSAPARTMAAASEPGTAPGESASNAPLADVAPGEGLRTAVAAEVEPASVAAASDPQPAEDTEAAAQLSSLRGVVLDDGGQPRPLTPLLLSSDSTDGGMVRLRTSTDEGGRFSFAELDAGDYTLTVLKDGRHSDEMGILHRTFQIDTGEEYDVEIPLADLDSVRITGTVRAPEELDYALVATFFPYSDDGAFVMGAPAAGYGDGSAEGGAEVAPGEFVAENLTEGTYLVLLMPAVDDHEGPFAFIPGFAVDQVSGGTIQRDFEYPGNVLTGHVLRKESTEGLIVTAVPVVPSGMAKVYSEGPKMARLVGRPVDENGAFEIPFIAEGSYRIDVFAGSRGMRLASQVVEVDGTMALPDWEIDQ